MKRKLTRKQLIFTMSYMETGNATESYRRSYNCSRMKATTIRRCAFDLMNNPNITAMVEHLNREEQARLKMKYQISNDRIVRELHRIAFSDITKVFNQDGRLLKLSEIDEDTRLALKSIDVVSRSLDEGEAVYLLKIKMLDKIRALIELARMLGMYEKDYSPRPSETPNHGENIEQHHWEPPDWMASLIPTIQDVPVTDMKNMPDKDELKKGVRQ